MRMLLAVVIGLVLCTATPPAESKEKVHTVRGRIEWVQIDRGRCRYRDRDEERGVNKSVLRCPARMMVKTANGRESVRYFSYPRREEWFHGGDSLSCTVNEHGYLGDLIFVGRDSIDNRNRRTITF